MTNLEKVDERKPNAWNWTAVEVNCSIAFKGIKDEVSALKLD
jgi:hypothetical protein